MRLSIRPFNNEVMVNKFGPNEDFTREMDAHT